MFAPNGNICKDAALLLNFRNLGYFPYVYTGPKDELLACRKTAWLGTFLNTSPVYDVFGPDLVKLLNKVTVNRDYAKLGVDKSRHAIICDDKGRILADGVLMRTGEDLYRSYWLAPILAYYVEVAAKEWGMDVSGRWVTDEFFLQIDGPKSLEIMEQACHEDLHGLRFAQNKAVEIAGIPCRIHRLGMSGALAYEMHGPFEKVEDVFEAIVEAGEPYGIRKLGFSNYCRNHTQGGYPNQWIHFWYPMASNGEAMKEYYAEHGGVLSSMTRYPFFGSAADDPENAFVTPYDVGWDYLINWDHDFIGKEALAAIDKNPPRKPVTLEWNLEDVGRAYADSIANPDWHPVDNIVSTGDGGDSKFVISKVMKDGRMVGVASGRTRDFYHNKMISLCWLERDLASEGTEVEVIWGTNPAAQVTIRATVARFPYYDEEYRNETFDVEKIPHYKG
ncbi:MAG: hypothetical protein ACOYIK_08880 [Coriobacteriales bacterium]|jgi:glycine cleavage system aminomethyltransferase T